LPSRAATRCCCSAVLVPSCPAHVARRFPHARQVALIERYVTRTVRVRKGKRWVRRQVKSAIAVFIITSLDAREAAPEHIAGYVRGHWTIENKVHYVRDVMFREDVSQVQSGPAQNHASWPRYVTSQSGSSARPATRR